MLQPKPSKRPKSVKISKSKIPNAGLGLFIMEAAKKGEFVARYSGEAIDRAENDRRTSNYRISISKNLYLDAKNSNHFEGRFINDGPRANKRPNVRFAAGYRTNVCSISGFNWIRIFALRNLKSGEELYLDYGSDFWQATQSSTTSPQPNE